MAVFTLPPELIGFYKKNIAFITEHAVDPDKRRYASKKEAPRHYIDIDYYAEENQNPFELMPKKWNAAVEKFSEDTLNAYGIVPWYVARMTNWLTKAFEEKNPSKILALSADIGHYIADAHVPLHTTVNYDGQLTNQRGIHGLWESRIPELNAENYDYLVGRAKYIDKPLDEIWKAVEESHSYVDSVLLIEQDLTSKIPRDQKYSFETRGASTVKQYSSFFANAYSNRMDNMVESRMRKAILFTGSIWFTAWVNAGQPNLNSFDKIDTAVIIEQQEQELEPNKRKIKGRSHSN